MTSLLDAISASPNEYGYRSFLTQGAILEGSLDQNFQQAAVRYGGKIENRSQLLSELAEKAGSRLDACLASSNEGGARYAEFGYALTGLAIAGRLHRLAEFDFALRKEIFREVPLADILLEIGTVQTELLHRLEEAFEDQKLDITRIYEAAIRTRLRERKTEKPAEKAQRLKVRGISTPEYLRKSYTDYLNYQTELLGFLGTINSISSETCPDASQCPYATTSRIVKTGFNFTRLLKGVTEMWKSREDDIWLPPSNYSSDISDDEEEEDAEKENKKKSASGISEGGRTGSPSGGKSRKEKEKIEKEEEKQDVQESKEISPSAPSSCLEVSANKYLVN